MPFIGTVRRPRIVAIVLLLAAVAVVIAGVLYPVAIPGPAIDLLLTGPTSTTSNLPDAVAPDPVEFLDLDLHKPLADLQPGPPPAPAADGLQGLRLTGTIIEPMHCFAVFTTTDGTAQIKTIGGRAGAADVTAITADSVTLNFNGNAIVLHVVKPAVVGRPRP